MSDPEVNLRAIDVVLALAPDRNLAARRYAHTDKHIPANPAVLARMSRWQRNMVGAHGQHAANFSTPLVETREPTAVAHTASTIGTVFGRLDEREYERDWTLPDDLAVSVPQAVLRDVARPVSYFEPRFEKQGELFEGEQAPLSVRDVPRLLQTSHRFRSVPTQSLQWPEEARGLRAYLRQSSWPTAVASLRKDPQS